MNVKNRKCIRKLSLKSLYANRRRNLTCSLVSPVNRRLRGMPRPARLSVRGKPGKIV